MNDRAMSLCVIGGSFPKYGASPGLRCSTSLRSSRQCRSRQCEWKQLKPYPRPATKLTTVSRRLSSECSSAQGAFNLNLPSSRYLARFRAHHDAVVIEEANQPSELNVLRF